MARVGKSRYVPKEGEIYIERRSEKSSIVFYEPHIDNIRIARTESENNRVKILTIDTEENLLSIYPINPYPSNNKIFLGQKYEKIKKITVGFDLYYKFTPSKNTVLDILEGLPAGFVKDYDYGLGLQKDYRFLIHSISEIPDIDTLKILKNEKTRIIDNEYILKYSDYNKIRKKINRITNKHRGNALIEKNTYSHNALLNRIDEKLYPKATKPYRKDIIHKTLDEYELENSDISNKDGSYLLETIRNNKNILIKNKSEILELKNDLDVINLKELINRFKKLLAIKSKESTWQKLLNENHFLLSLIFNYPIIKINQQVSIGGRTYSGSGEKITDFLVKNELSSNAALVEIKKPHTGVIGTKEYRGGVYSPSSELTSSITQILDQKYLFTQQINNLNAQSEEKVESFSINCILIIGQMPEERLRKKSFELFRNNSKEVIVVTFDELLSKLQSLYKFLK